MNPTELHIGQAYFWVCAAMAVAGAVFTVTAKNPIRGAMGLLLMILAVAGVSHARDSDARRTTERLSPLQEERRDARPRTNFEK